MKGELILNLCREQVLDAMADMPECQPGNEGATNKAIEEAAGLALELPEQDGWITWSILRDLLERGQGERLVVPHGKVVRHNYRLVSQNQAG